MATIREHLQQAQDLASAGRIADALELCRRVRGAAPDQPAAAALEAALLLQADKPGEALALLDDLTSSHDTPDLWANKGLALHRLERIDEARAALHRAIRLQPAHRATNLNLAALHLESREHDEAIACYERILEAKPGSVPARAGLAAALLESGDAQGAIEQARLATSGAPKSADPHITLAAAHARLGHFRDAERSARSAIALASNNSRARAVLAEVLVVTGRGGEAIPQLEAMLAFGDDAEKQRARTIAKAVRTVVRDAMGDVESRRAALALLQSGRASEAREAFRSITESSPDDYHARFGLGLALGELRQYPDALAQIDAAIAMQPVLPRFHYERARILFGLGRRGEAISACRTALMIAPRDHEALNLGARMLVDSGQPGDAIATLRTLLLHHDSDLEARVLLANILVEEGLEKEAEAQLAEIERRAPQRSAIWSARATIHERHDRLDEALAAYDRALELHPDDADAHVGRGNILVKLRRLDEGAASLDRAVALNPHSARAVFNRGTRNLIMGNYREGWKGYAHRERVRDASPVYLPTPRWRGEALDGRTLLIYSEQGLGDTLMFSRLIPALGKLDGRVLFRPHKPLAHFFRDFPGVDELLVGVKDEDLASVPHDVHVPLLDLLAILDVERDSVPANIPYLKAEEERVAHWREWLDERPGLRVGIAWQGNPRYAPDRQRSVRLELFELLAQVEGVRLIGLQKGPGREQLAALGDRFPVEDLGLLLDNDGHAFADTAAALQSLDVLVASDSAIVHLAGALGVLCWTLLAHTPEWRWGLEGETTPWYPGMRLYRQAEPGGWPDVMRRVAVDLSRLARLK